MLFPAAVRPAALGTAAALRKGLCGGKRWRIGAAFRNKNKLGSAEASRSPGKSPSPPTCHSPPKPERKGNENVSIISVDLQRGTTSYGAQPARSFTSDFTRQSRSKELILFASARLMCRSRQRGRTADTQRLVPFLPCLCKSSERENQRRGTLGLRQGPRETPGSAHPEAGVRAAALLRGSPHSRYELPSRAEVKRGEAPEPSRSPAASVSPLRAPHHGCERGMRRRRAERQPGGHFI